MQETRRAILRALEDGPVTGPELADRLGVSRAAIWKHVEALRDAGFEISDGSEGYTVELIPEYGEAAVVFGLDAPFEVEYHQQISSTNTRARELAKSGATDVAVLADEQTGGRGRLDREWHSPSGGVWLSILVRPDRPAMHAPVYTLAAAVATAEAVRALGVDAAIKWPNDVLVDGDKVAGILTEMEGEADRISWLVVGVGINANVDPSAIPTDRDATSLRAFVGDVDRRALTQSLLERFDALRSDLDAVLPAWRGLSETLGRRVRVETGEHTVTGEAVDITYPGSLVVDTGTARIEVAAGDCEHLRSVETDQ
jgi:BirA family biotin operon repressor/biotin-[acetyl-CoA-carboxylase] ligase